MPYILHEFFYSNRTEKLVQSSARFDTIYGITHFLEYFDFKTEESNIFTFIIEVI